MSGDLEVLAAHKEQLRLAEVAAWLHDAGKCSDEFVKWNSREIADARNTGDRSSEYWHFIETYGPIGRAPLETELARALPPAFKELRVFGETTSVEDLVHRGNNPRRLYSGRNDGLAVQVLQRCHSAAHFTKEEPERTDPGLQSVDGTRLSTPFGIEGDPLRDLTPSVRKLPFAHALNRTEFEEKLTQTFRHAPGDVRRPINDVDLWSWSASVAALYKAALAGALLTNQRPNPQDYASLSWRLLAVRFDWSAVTEHVLSIPALLARTGWLQAGLDRARTLLEEDYPLGTEVYRDENGSIFVVPDLPDLGAYTDRNGTSLSDLIAHRLAFDGEVHLTPSLDSEGWYGDPPPTERDQGIPSQVPPIARLLETVPSSPADPAAMRIWWSAPDARGKEVCTVSGVRPQGPSREGVRRKLSDTWKNRSSGSAREWLAHRDTTIWLDEVTDANGRICLVVASFGLDGWLQSDGYAGSTLVVAPDDGNREALPKNASFARLFRIWETTSEFWAEVEGAFPDVVGSVGQRLRVTGRFEPAPNAAELSLDFNYDLRLGESSLGVLHHLGPDGARSFVTTSGLQSLARALVAQADDWRDDRRAAEFIVDHLRRERRIVVEEPTGYGRPDLHRGELYIDSVDIEGLPYLPAVTILREPRRFMVLVPADKAPAVAATIARQYERDMAKVRNRLPLSLGLVFAGGRLPLPALLDAGRRMLRQPSVEETWTVESAQRVPQADAAPGEVLVTLTREGEAVSLRVPTTMGDGKTPDVWYPYWEVKGAEAGADGSRRWFRQQRQDGSARTWVHVADLRSGEQVVYLPSRFDFEYLDVAARRFEITYEQGGQRRARPSRPFHLQQLAELRRIASELDHRLKRSQLKQLTGVLERIGAEWDGGSVAQKMERAALANAEWKDGRRPSQELMETLCAAAARGHLTDAIELFLDIPKPARREDDDQGGSEW